MDGCGQVYHLAGAVSRDPRDDWKMYDIHIGGTRNICEAALQHRPEKLVIVSSSGTIAVSKEPEMLDETAGYPLETIGEWGYYLSKVYTEKMVLDYVRRHDLPAVIANPALLLGPGDDLGSSTGDVALFLQGQVMALPLGGHVLRRRPRRRGRFDCGHARRTYRRAVPARWRELVLQADYRDASREISGKRPPILQPPLGFSLWSARLLRRLMPLVGREMKMDDVTIRMSSHFWYFSSAKAERELGFKARDPVETIRATVEDIINRPA